MAQLLSHPKKTVILLCGGDEITLEVTGDRRLRSAA